MNIRLTYLTLLFLCLLLLMVGAAKAEPTKVTLVFASNTTELTVNERRAGFAGLATFLAKERQAKEHVIFLHGGNSLGPSLLGSFDQGAHIIKLLNILKPDAMTLAGHEFVYGHDVLAKRIGEADFPVISANLTEKKTGNPLPGTLTNKLISAGPLKIGVVGVVSEEALTKFLVPEVDISERTPVITSTIDALRTQGADIIVLMLDSPLQDLDRIRKDQGIDIVLLEDTESTAAQSDDEGIVVRQGGLRRLVAIDLQQENDGATWSMTPRIEPLYSLPMESTILAELGRLQASVSANLDREIGKVELPLDTTRLAVRTGENAFGNFIADTLRSTMGGEIGLFNGGAIRGDRVYEPDTVLTHRDMVTELPFTSYPTLIQVTGRQLREAVENGLSKIEDTGGRFPHLSNVSVAYDPEQPPGLRVLEMKISGETVDPDATYSLATIDYLANGGDGYEMLKNSERLVAPDRSKILWHLVAEAITKNDGISAQREGRYIIRRAPDVLVKSNSGNIEYSVEEKAWIRTNPVIRVHNETDWPPFNFAEDGQPRGYSVDYMNILAAKSGLKVEYVTGPTWDDFLGMMRRGDLDVMLNIVQTPERQEYLLFTEPYSTNPNVILSRQNKPFNSLEELTGKIIAVPKGFYFEEILRRDYPEITIRTENNVLDSMKAVATGKADAVLDAVATFNYLITQHALIGLTLSSPVTVGELDTSQLSIATRLQEPLLLSILGKAMESVTTEEKTTLLNRWIGKISGRTDGVELGLTQQERSWIAKHNTFSLGVDPSWPPFEFFDEEGVYSGIGAGYVELLSTRLGVKMIPQKGLSWAEMIEKAQAGEIDILPSVAKTPGREKYLNFSKPYISFPIVITTRKDAAFVLNLEGLDGKKVGVVKGYATHEILITNHKDIEAVPFQTLSEGLQSLNDGKVDAFIDNLLTITFEIDRSGFDNLKIASPTQYKFELAMAVRKGLPELVPILDKALETINKRERAAIVNSWTAIRVDYGIDVKTILLWVVPIGTFAVLIIIAVVMVNRRMSHEISEREQAEQTLEKERYVLRSVLENTVQAIVAVDKNLDIIACNAQFQDLLSLPDELIAPGTSFRAVVEQAADIGFYGEGNKQDLVEARMKALTSGKPLSVEIQTKDGLTWYATLQPHADGGFVMTYTDMTERKLAEENLRKSEETFHAVVDQLPASIMLKDAEGRFTIMNKTAKEWYGKDGEKLIGKTSHDLFSKDVADKLRATDLHVMKSGDVIHEEFDEPFADGVVRTLFMSKFPILGPDGKAVAIGTVETDITPIKDVEEKLRKSEETFRAVVDQLPAAIVIKDMEGRYTLANKRFTEWFAKDGEDVIGKTSHDLYPNDVADKLLSIDREILKTGEVVHEEIAEPFADGSIHTTLLSKFPIKDPDGEVISVGTVETDITDRKQAEEILANAFEIISSSIDYASRIQRSILPEDGLLSSALSEHFILWEPRDVVGGDIYWAGAWGDGFLFVLGDCTGHGVPGAFMTLISMGALERAMNEVDGGHVGALINRMHQFVQTTLGQHLEGGESDDGIELGACYFVPEGRQMTFVGARFPLFIVDNGDVTEIKGTKKGIGYCGISLDQTYEEVIIELKFDMSFYMSSDGFLDQVGGERTRMFGKKRFRKLLLEMEDLPFAKQKEKLYEALLDHQGEETRRDDVAVVGFKI